MHNMICVPIQYTHDNVLQMPIYAQRTNDKCSKYFTLNVPSYMSLSSYMFSEKS